MLRIKVAILDYDETYSGRLVNAFNTYYQDKLEVYSFTDKEMATSFLESSKIDVFLADESIDIDIKSIPQRCAFAYLCMMNSVDTVNGQKAICKFQRVDLIYKEILSVFAEVSSYSVSTGKTDGKSPIKLFISAAGGTGKSTVAAAYAIGKARKGGSPFYLNLELFGGAGELFEGDGAMNLSDVIYSLKSKKANIALKIESSVKKSPEGVSFIDSANIVLDVKELNEENIITLIDEISNLQSYDEVLVDIGFSMSDLDMQLIRKADAVLVISDGTEICNEKTARFLQSIQIIEQQKDEHLTSKMNIFYNKFSSTFGRKLDNCPIGEIGGSAKVEGNTKHILAVLAANGDLQKF